MKMTKACRCIALILILVLLCGLIQTAGADVVSLGIYFCGRKTAEDGSFIIVYISNENADFELELTWLRDHPQKYDIGEEEFHLAFKTDDFEAAHKLHEEMGCICFENHSMGIYFIQDPDGYWLEVIPERR